MSSFNPDIHVPGLWRCAKCNFVLVQSNLNATDGTVTARDQAGDKCPNDGAPLWRMTWKEQARDLGKMCEDAIERAKGAENLLDEVEQRFPNWRSYRDLIDCVDCTMARPT